MLYHLSYIPVAEMAGFEPATIRLKVDTVCMLCRLGRDPPVAGPPRFELGTSSARTRCSTKLSYRPLLCFRIRAQKKRPCFSPDAELIGTV